MQNYDVGGRYYIVPQDPETRDRLLAVDRRCKGDVNALYRLPIDYDWYANTIAACVVESCISALGLELMAGNIGNYGSFNFYDLFSMKVSIKHDADAEKEGNINIIFEPGPDAIALISDTVPDNEKEIQPIDPLVRFSMEDPALTEALMDMDRHARYAIGAKHSITMSDKMAFAAFAVAHTFITDLFKELLVDLGSNPDKEISSINFNDDIEFHAVRKGDGIIFSMRPGMNAKLLIKADDATELDDE